MWRENEDKKWQEAVKTGAILKKKKATNYDKNNF